MNFYYFSDAAEVVGPIQREELQQLLDNGILAETTQVCYEGSEEWQPITSYIRRTKKPVLPKPVSIVPVKAPVPKQVSSVKQISHSDARGESQPAAPKGFPFAGKLVVIFLLMIGAILVWAFAMGSVSTSDLSSGSISRITEQILDGGYVASTNHDTEISGILSQQSLNDIGARSVMQQFANGSYRYADMLAVIAKELDRHNENTSALSAINSQKTMNDISSNSAIQQAANGTYRCVDYLAIITQEVDRDSHYHSEIQSVVSQMHLNDISAGSAYQQIANGTYRSAELSAIACKAADRKGRFTTEVSGLLSQMRINEISSRSAPQQAANGLLTSAKLMAVFAQLMDRKDAYTTSISAELTQLNLNDISSDTAYQQMANAFYRLTAIAGYAAKGLNP